MMVCEGGIMEYGDIKLCISYKTTISKWIREDMGAHSMVVEAKQRVHIQFIALDLLSSSCCLTVRSHVPSSIVVINISILISFRVLLNLSASYVIAWLPSNLLFKCQFVAF